MCVSEFPYENENRSLFVFLPTILRRPVDFSERRFAANGVFDLIERLSTEEAMCTLRNLLDSDTPSEDAYDNFEIEPIFNLEEDVPMLPLFEAFGIEELLKPNAINLDSFFVNDDSKHLGNAMHRIRIEVTENYTAAGAVNVIYSGQGIPALGKRMHDGYDYPFVWLIYDKKRRNVLFAGAFNNLDYFPINHILTFPPNISVPLDID
ncbi:antithrombin-iii-like isoform 2 protein [Lasius niger]|uniref:Antithrombin-iii-like isoform 2 protein n=1 Tax=Lasius niger TaxID=67767 RepID=A0A0J7K1P5_LASNI|nr:antithrombin-iii-like isoform 2 protein [Lasius niger]